MTQEHTITFHLCYFFNPKETLPPLTFFLSQYATTLKKGLLYLVYCPVLPYKCVLYSFSCLKVGTVLVMNRSDSDAFIF